MEYPYYGYFAIMYTCFGCGRVLWLRALCEQFDADDQPQAVFGEAKEQALLMHSRVCGVLSKGIVARRAPR